MADPMNPYKEAHREPNGVGDARPEAMAVIKDLGLTNKMTDKCMLVTGSSSGIGVETVRALYATGAKVFMQVRNREKGQRVLEEIQSSTPSQGSLHLVMMSLDSLQSVRDGAAALLSQTNQLNVLVTNAGVRNTPESTTVDGYETQFATNHLGHFLLFQLLKDTLLASSTPAFASRVVSVSSGGHFRATVDLDNPNLKGVYEPRRGYASSKTANIWMANHIETLYGARGLHALSVHPGCIKTGLQTDHDALEERLKHDVELRRALKTTGQGAATQVWAAVAPVWEGKGGKYLEDMRVSHETDQMSMLWGGYSKHIFDPKAEERLWQISNEMVGTTG